MAKFNENLVNVESVDKERAGMTLQGLLSDEEHEKISEDFTKTNKGLECGDKNFIPWWKFCLDNITVSYHGTEDKTND